MAVTQTDIAKAAGVSRGTVDRALKQLNDPSFGVRERMLRVDTEQESQKAILALYYALKNNHPPQKDVYYTDMQIISKEMV